MQLGFVSAILPDQSLEQVLSIASEIGYDCVEVMCWPKGKAERRYAGVTHIDVDNLDDGEIRRIHDMVAHYQVNISGLGYYPNPLVADADQGNVYIRHIEKVIEATARLGLTNMNTFVGRDHTKSVEDNWPRFLAVWRPLVAKAEAHGVNIGIENCPMIFTDDEWPGGKNLATTPSIWDRMWNDIPSPHFGLNFDPSHFIWQHMDYLDAIRRYCHRFHHVHAKDVRIDTHLLNQHGIMAPPNLWHTPKLPGMGQVEWGQFFSELTSAGYQGAVCVEVEDRAFEGSFEARVRSLRQSFSYLRQYVC